MIWLISSTIDWIWSSLSSRSLLAGWRWGMGLGFVRHRFALNRAEELIDRFSRLGGREGAASSIELDTFVVNNATKTESSSLTCSSIENWAMIRNEFDLLEWMRCCTLMKRKPEGKIRQEKRSRAKRDRCYLNCLHQFFSNFPLFIVFIRLELTIQKE